LYLATIYSSVSYDYNAPFNFHIIYFMYQYINILIY